MQLTPIPNYEGRYSITKTGDVWSAPYTRTDGRCRKGLWLKPGVSKYGYKQVVLTGTDGKRTTISVHRLVAITFMDLQDGLQVNHRDGDKLNNSLSNLEWCTQEDNMKHAHRTGLINHRGLSDDQVLEVRSMLKKGFQQVTIAKILKLEQSLVSKIKTGFLYKDVTLTS